MKKLICCAVLLLMGVVFSAYAEVQNVKVSGDINVRGFYRGDYDLNKNDETSVAGGTSSGVTSDNDEFIMSTVGVNVDADLTDNVSTRVRLVNQRDWQTYAGSANTDIDLDEMYVTLKEAFYSPLTVTVGRQPLWFGKGFIIGDSQSVSADPDVSIQADEFTDFNAFDAFRATLDFEPWTIDAFWSKIKENTGNATDEDDIDLLGLNAGYKFDSYNAEAEAYLFAKHDRSTAGVTPASKTTRTNETDVLGARGSMEPLDNWYLFGELAYQFGDYSDTTTKTADRKAWAFDLGGDYTFADAEWKPKLGVEYILYTGGNPTRAAGATADYEFWQDLYKGKFTTLIRDFQGGTGDASQSYGLTTNYYNPDDIYDQTSTTNQHLFAIYGSCKPMEDLLAAARWSYFRMDEPYKSSRTEKELGHELDLQLAYDYTEDVQLSLLAGFFFPGSYWDKAVDDGTDIKSNDKAVEVVGGMKVVF